MCDHGRHTPHDLREAGSDSNVSTKLSINFIKDLCHAM